MLIIIKINWSIVEYLDLDKEEFFIAAKQLW